MFMDREQEEAVLRITAQYVEEVQAGQQPNVSDYLARYPQYAKKIGLAVDIVTKLEHHTIKASSIPRGLLNRLAEVLQHPLSAIQAYFEPPNEQLSSRHQVAEAQSAYPMEELSQSFREAV